MKKLLYIGNKLEKHGAAPTSADTLPPLLRKEGFEVQVVSSVRNKAGRLLDMVSSLLLNHKKTDFVLIDTYSTANFWYAVICGYLCRMLGVKYIFLLHGGKLDSRFAEVSENIIELFRQAEANIVPSAYLTEKLETFHFNNLYPVPNWIDMDLYPFQLRNKLRPRILWLRSFDKVYNPVMATGVLEELLKDHPEAELCMVGPEKDGSMKTTRKVVKEKRLPVEFKGKLTKEEWIPLSANYDIFINTTSVDNTPVSVIEAMALGLPVVSTNAGGLPYLIDDGETGLLVDPDDSKAMAEGIIKLLSDSQLARKIGLKARRKVENYDWQKVRQNWLELLS